MRMRRFALRWLVPVLAALLLLPAPVTLASAPEVSLLVNGQSPCLEVAPVIQEGTTLVPLRAIFEALGATVSYAPSTRVITGTRGDTTIKLTVGDANATVNGRPLVLAVPPQIVNGRTLVPARFVAESLGATVTWQADSRTVNVQAVIPPSPAVSPGQFADANLEAAVREALNKPTGALTGADLAKLYQLLATGKGIQDLRGLEYAVNLRSLDLEGNQVSDLTPLAALTQLEDLNLTHNRVRRLEPLAPLSRLRNLRLSALMDSKEDVLTPLPKDCSGNYIASIAPLAGLTRLTSLDLRDNPISDLTPLARMSEMNDLQLNRTRVSDLTPLAGMAKMRRLTVGGTGVTDLAALAEMPVLSDLHIFSTGVQDLTPLAGLTGLTRLSLLSTDVTDLAPLASLARNGKLAVVSLQNNRSLDLSPGSAAQVVLDTLRAGGVRVEIQP